MTSQTSRGLLVVVLCVAAYLSNCRTVPVTRGGDTIPNRLIPFSILMGQGPTLTPFRADFAASGVTTWYLQERRGELVTFYPIGTALAALPFYAPIYGFFAIGGMPGSSTLFAISEPAEKITAVAITALAVWLFWLTARRRLPPREAFWAAVAFGLGSSMWATASQMLWQQTTIAAAVTTALWLLTWPGFPRRAAAGVGLVLSLAVAARPTAGLLFLAGLAATVVIAKKRWLGHAAAFCFSALPLIALTLAVNWYYFGHISGGYHFLVGSTTTRLFSLESKIGVLGLLFSPNRGLLIFMPIALLGIVGLARQVIEREGRDPVLLAFGAAALAHLLVAGSYWDWVGGWSFGPRYLVDTLPVLALAGVDVWPRLPRWARPLAIVALVGSVLVQINGAFCYPASLWNGRVLMADYEGAPWNWRQFELWEDFKYWWWGRMWSAPY